MQRRPGGEACTGRDVQAPDRSGGAERRGDQGESGIGADPDRMAQVHQHRVAPTGEDVDHVDRCVDHGAVRDVEVHPGRRQRQVQRVEGVARLVADQVVGGDRRVGLQRRGELGHRQAVGGDLARHRRSETAVDEHQPVAAQVGNAAEQRFDDRVVGGDVGHATGRRHERGVEQTLQSDVAPVLELPGREAALGDEVDRRRPQARQPLRIVRFSDGDGAGVGQFGERDACGARHRGGHRTPSSSSPT